MNAESDVVPEPRFLKLETRTALDEGIDQVLQLARRQIGCGAGSRRRVGDRVDDVGAVVGVGAHHQPAIERVIRHILQRFREPIPLAHVLQIAGMSKATFARQFRKHAGRPFSAFVNQVRLDAACRYCSVLFDVCAESRLQQRKCCPDCTHIIDPEGDTP